MSGERGTAWFRGPLDTRAAVVSALIGGYGPIAFGVVMLLVVWAMIVGPEIGQVRDQGVALAVTTARTVDKLERIIDRLERMETKR